MGYSSHATRARTCQPESLMPLTTRTTSSRPEPLDFAYQHGQELPTGAQFMILPTLEDLERHWARIRHSLPFAAQGNCPGSRPLYLRPHEWIFAPSRPTLIQAVVRWKEVGIQPSWYDWRSENPEEYKYYFDEREATRRKRIEEGNWTLSDEQVYCAAVKRKNQDNFQGWWRLTNLPHDQVHETWFSGLLDEPSNPKLDTDEVNRIFQWQTYIDWQYQSIDEVVFLGAVEMEEELQHWREEGIENRTLYGDP